MITKYITWHKVKIRCKQDPSINYTILDAMVEVNAGMCHIRSQGANHSYMQATVDKFTPYEMVISATWFSCRIGEGDEQNEFKPVKITCIYEQCEHKR